MKKIIFFVLSVLTFSLVACYIHDPAVYLKKQEEVVTLKDEAEITKATITYELPYTDENIGKGTWNGQQFDLQCKTAFPFTVELQVQLYGDNGEPEKITRASLLCLNKYGDWQIVKDIKDVSWDISSNDGSAKAIFGQDSIKNTMGYQDGEVMFIMTYFESANQTTHDLDGILSTRQTKESLTSERLNNLGAIAIGVSTNRKPR